MPVDFFRWNDFFRRGTGARHFPKHDGQRFPDDEKENEKDHENGRKRHEKNSLLDDPFQGTSLVTARKAHPSDAAFGMVLVSHGNPVDEKDMNIEHPTSNVQHRTKAP